MQLWQKMGLWVLGITACAAPLAINTLPQHKPALLAVYEKAPPTIAPAKSLEIPAPTKVATHQSSHNEALMLLLNPAMEEKNSVERLEIEALQRFYRARNFATLWHKDGQITAQALKLQNALWQAQQHGLNPADYAPSASQSTTKDEAIAQNDVALSRVTLRYVRHLQAGRFQPSQVNKLVTPKPEHPDLDQVLATISSAPDILASLETYAPPHKGYHALKALLAEALKNADNSAKIELLAANMERWRWLPRELGDTHIFVNIPQFQLKVIKNHQITHQTRVVVGKPETPTPVFSEEMEHIVVNPAWNVPISIARKEFLPKLQRDPQALSRQGIEVIAGGRVINPAQIDWSKANINRVYFRQPPGDRNALGHIKFMFPNEHAVYLHDTSSRALFQRDVRAFSHGCVRVMHPFELAEVVLRNQKNWSAERIKSMVGRGERTIFLEQKLPVHLAYFTLKVNENGELEKFTDIYSLDRKMVSLMRQIPQLARTSKMP